MVLNVHYIALGKFDFERTVWVHFFDNYVSTKVQYTLDLRKPDLRKNLDLRKIAGATDFLVHKLFDLRKIFKGLMFDLRKFFPKKWKE